MVYGSCVALWSTVESGYLAHVPITLNGKKCALSKQVSKYVVMAFFYGKISIISLVCICYGFVLCTIHALRTFSIVRLLNARLPLAGF